MLDEYRTWRRRGVGAYLSSRRAASCSPIHDAINRPGSAIRPQERRPVAPPAGSVLRITHARSVPGIASQARRLLADSTGAPEIFQLNLVAAYGRSVPHIASQIRGPIAPYAVPVPDVV
eukprot:139211-Rhodomonas_salina.4